MLSHDTRIRCDLVDLYYTLYGNRRPICIPLPELSGLMNLTRPDIKKIKTVIPKLAHADSSDIKKEFPSPKIKTEVKEIPTSSVIVDNNAECNMNIDVVAIEENKVKVEYFKCFFNHNQRLHKVHRTKQKMGLPEFEYVRIAQNISK